MTYRATSGAAIVRIADGAFIPADPDNADYQDFLRWKAGGGVVEPLPPPPPPSREEMEAAAVRADPNLIALRDATPDAVRAYIDARLADLTTAQGQANLVEDFKTLAVAVGILARRL